jgi:hypothetical protein
MKENVMDASFYEGGLARQDQLEEKKIPSWVTRPSSCWVTWRHYGWGYWVESPHNFNIHFLCGDHNIRCSEEIIMDNVPAGVEEYANKVFQALSLSKSKWKTKTAFLSTHMKGSSKA